MHVCVHISVKCVCVCVCVCVFMCTTKHIRMGIIFAFARL